MKLFVVLLVVLVCLEVTSASRLGRVFGSAFAVHKKTKKTAANKKGEATVKSNKIKQTPVQKLKEDIDVSNQKVKIDVVEGPAKEDPTRAANLLKRQSSLLGRQNMVLSIGRMVLSRFVFKINYKDPKTLVYARLTFVGYLLLYQALLWFLSQQVNKRDDSTILHKPSNSGMQALLSKVGSLSGQSAMTSTLLNLAKLASPAEDEITVKAHDTKQIKELTSTLYFELFTTSVMHFVFGFQVPVLMAPLMGVCKLLQHPLVLLHVFRMRPVGQLERPFKTGLETFMSALTPAKPFADAVASTSVANSTSAGADARPSDKRVVGATMISRPVEEVENEDSDVSDEVEREEEEEEEEGVREEVVSAGTSDSGDDSSTDIAEDNKIVDASAEDEVDEQEATEADQDAVVRGEGHVEEEIEVEAGDVENEVEVEVGEGEVEEGAQAPAETEKSHPESDESCVSEEEVEQRQEEADGDEMVGDEEAGAVEGEVEDEEEDGDSEETEDASEEDGDSEETEDASEEDAQDTVGEEEEEAVEEEEEERDDSDADEEEDEEEKEWWEKEEEEEEEDTSDDDELLNAIDHLGD